jgi:pimeloyl-ACP methyl ester carboxylesterase
MFILIHGANHSSRCWEPMIDYLDAPALAIDLPGRGRHPAPLDNVHLSDFIESAVADIEGADPRDAILVGHSMAGLSIPGIVDRVHDRLRHVVFVSCNVPAHGESMLSEMPEDLRELGARSCGCTPRQEVGRANDVHRNGRGPDSIHARRSRAGGLLAHARPR